MVRKRRKLNIVHLHWGFPPIIGGVETHLAIMLPTMVEMGHNVFLLTGTAEGTKVKDNYKGVKVLRTPLMDLNWLYRRGLEGLEEELSELYKRFFDSTKPDIIHAHNMHYFSKIHARLLEREAHRKKIPLILTAHNVWDDILFLDLTLNISWDHIIAVSHFIKREIIGIGYDDRKITVVHHGIDTDRFNPKLDAAKIFKKYPQLKRRKIVLHPARIGLAKGADVSIKAIRLVREKFPDVMLIMCGSKYIIDWGETQQKDIAYFVNLIKWFKLENNVLIDAFKLDEMPQLYAVAHVCVYPSSVGEPFGLTMLEAMASAKPMIVTDSGGMPEIIKDGINGFVIPIKDFEALSARIILLLTDQRLRNRLGYTGRQMALQSYTRQVVTQNTLNIYKELLS